MTLGEAEPGSAHRGASREQVKGTCRNSRDPVDTATLALVTRTGCSPGLRQRFLRIPGPLLFPGLAMLNVSSPRSGQEGQDLLDQQSSCHTLDIQYILLQHGTLSRAGTGCGRNTQAVVPMGPWRMSFLCSVTLGKPSYPSGLHPPSLSIKPALLSGAGMVCMGSYRTLEM